ncbi:MAG: ABC transporter substrate-binding protein [Nitrospinae bacterium]|nr:ABC transporter substrate-binding protein [Nitrospinota bacterium]
MRTFARLLALAICVAAMPAVVDSARGGQPAVPASVGKLTVAVDGWGVNELDPWTLSSVAFLHDYFNLRLMGQDEDGKIVPLWATEGKLTDEGASFTLNPKAKWQDGRPATAEDLKMNFEGMMGKYDPQFKGVWNGGQLRDTIQEIQVLDQHRIFIKTTRPNPFFLSQWAGIAYHLIWYGHAKYLREVGHDGYIKNPIGGGPYKVKEWKAGERIVFERWEDFWADYPWYKKPQAKTMEILRVPDGAARFAVLQSGQADVVSNIPYAIAKALPRQRGKGLWIRPYEATGHMGITFVNTMTMLEGTATEQDRRDPTLDPRVREALELAIDKRAISEKAHFGLTAPTNSIYSPGSFGWRPEVGNKISPYDPERAKQLLKEAGYPDGFSITMHFGQFTGRPGIPEAIDAIAGYWARIGVKMTAVEHDASEFVARVRAPERAWRPIMLQTFGRLEHSGVRINDSYHKNSPYSAAWNERAHELWLQASSTTDEAKQLAALAGIEDEILRHRYVIPLYAASLVMGYTDRVLAHPTPKYSPHFMDLDRIVLKD